MSNFEVFNKSRTYGASRLGMTITISSRGQLNLGGEAHKNLGKPEYVEFLYDPTRKIFAIRPAKTRSNGYKLRKPTKSGYTTVFAKHALDTYGINYTETRKYTPWVENNAIMCIDVSEVTK